MAQKDPPSGGWKVGCILLMFNSWWKQLRSRLHTIILRAKPMPYVIHLGVRHMVLHCRINDASAICPIVKYYDFLVCKTSHIGKLRYHPFVPNEIVHSYSFALLYCAELMPSSTPRKVSTAVMVPTISSP